MARQPSPQDAAFAGYATCPVPGTVRLERGYAATPEVLWAYLVDPLRRRDWLAAGRIDPHSGGRVELSWHFDELSPFEPIPPRFAAHGTGYTHSGRVTRAEPGRMLAFTWGQDAEVVFEIAPRSGGAALVVTHRRLEDRPEMIRIASGWFTHMLLLEDVVLERARRPFWESFVRAEAEHERLLGEPPLTIQVARLFRVPPERVFDAWLGVRRVPLWMFADDGAELVRAEHDARPGGGFVFTARQETGEIEHAGSYVEIARPDRIVFTFGIPELTPELDRVMLEFDGIGGGCDVLLVHEMRPVWADYSDRAEAGWAQILRQIAADLGA